MKICIPIREKLLKKAKEQIKKAVAKADFIEIWLDNFHADDLKELIGLAKKPVIAVCRGSIEKGSFKGKESERVEVLKRALESGAKLVDVGIDTAPHFIRDIKKASRIHRAKMIISKHFWNETPPLAMLEKTVKKARNLGADIVKIATHVLSWADNAVLFELTTRARKKRINIIAVGMGKRGKISRIGCPLLGSFLTYVALDKKSKTAPGQLTLHEFSLFNFPL